MSTAHHPFHIQSCGVRAAAALVLCAMSAGALPSAPTTDGREVKFARPLPMATDVKTPAPPVIKTPSQTTRPAPPASPGTAIAKTTTARAPRNARLEPDRVYFDAPGDGTLWARGRTYKAAFAADGTTFIPFLGSCAPTNHPVRFTLSDVRVGGTSLAFVPAMSPVRAENSITFDRGAVIERYDLAPDGIEQSFVIAAVPARGELAVRIDVASDLAVRERDGGLEFSGELGAVRYGRASVADAAGRTQVAESVRVAGAIELRVPAAFMQDAVLPITIDPLVSTFDVDVSADDDIRPDIAYDVAHDRYCVCWEDAFSASDHDVYVQMQNASGNTISGSTMAIDITTNYWARPKIANNLVASQFLVVAQVGDPSSGARIIRGRTRDVGVASVGPQFTISGGLVGDQINPDVGGDPNPAPPTYYCVVWERVYLANDHDIWCQLVAADEALLTPNGIGIDNTASTLDENPSVSKSDGAPPSDSQEWNIVWQREVSSNDCDIHGAQVHWDGNITTASFGIDTSSDDTRQPTASSLLDGGISPRHYLVAWQADFGDHDILGAVLKGSNHTTPVTNLTFLEGAPIAEDQLDPRADSDGLRFGVAYRESFNLTADYDVYMASFALQSGLLIRVEGHELLDGSPDPQSQAQLTARHSGGGSAQRYAAVWNDEGTPLNHDIRGALYDSPLVASFCFPSISGAIACPCGNNGSAGQGCNNSANTGGAYLYSTGTPSLSSDTLVFHQSNEISSALSIVLQGNSPVAAGVVFGDGVRCVGGTLKRLYSHNATSGVVFAPLNTEPPVHTRSAALGDTIAAGDMRYYQVYYRDPNLAFCPSPQGNTWNVGNGLIVTWIP